VKTHRAKFPDQIETPYYYWPEAGRGQVVLDDNGYKRAVELLLHLQFEGIEQAIASTSRWINEVNMGENWALPVVGENITAPQSPPSAPGVVNNLGGLITRKRKSEDGFAKESATVPVNVLGGGLVRKKVKVAPDAASTGLERADTVVTEPKVNVLGTGLVRRKAKAM
jgi:regulator of Ty1 transposition protein 109